MYDIILSFITAFLLSFYAIPSIINIAKTKRLFDEPGERSSHTESIPRLGGFAIFAGVFFATTFWTPFVVFNELQYILCALIIMFLVGAKDDIIPMSPGKKLIGQILAAGILVSKADVKLTSLYGLFGIYDIHPIVSIILSTFTIILIINSFNLIDGINGLSSSLGGIISCSFGIWFYMVDESQFAIMAFALTGSLVAFFKYNYTPAKIFMGDTGSLITGLICSILAIKFIEINKLLLLSGDSLAVKSVPAVTMGILIIPLFDTLRVFVTRILKGKSPFYPDKTHIHHLLLDVGCSHMQGTAVLVLVNVFFVILAYSLQNLGTLSLMIVILAVATILSSILYYMARKKKIAKQQQLKLENQ